AGGTQQHSEQEKKRSARESAQEFRLFLVSGVICAVQVTLACLFALRPTLGVRFYFLFNFV
ncbi:hypothetical protein AAVH_37452, partial [Aphelenchoides avenae]